MSSGQKRALQSDGVGETFRPPVDLIVIAEEDPEHPNHHEHMARVRIDKPEMIALLESFRAFGWRKSKTISVYLDGDAYTVSDGRRSVTAARIVNAEWKKARDPRYPLRPRVVIDDDPKLTETLANSMREGDPPMVLARRFVENRETMGAGKAAAALGLTLAMANDLAAVLATPNAALHAAVNDRSVPADVAKRAAKAGSATVRKVLADAKGADGKVDANKAKAAAREAVPTRAKALPRPVAEAMFARVSTWDTLGHFTPADLAAFGRYLLGDREQATGRPWLVTLGTEAARAAKGGAA